jgi:hypothetical protein
MNERIRELAEQAGFQYIKDEGIGWAGNHNASLPKFAELIVKECAQVCRNQPNEYALAVDRENCASAIEEHFGVEL